MIANPFYPRYRTFSSSPTRTPGELPSSRLRIIYGANLGITFIFSLCSYILCFTDVLPYSFISTIYFNSSINSILTPYPWTQYIQWFVYASMISTISLHICNSKNKYTMYKLYETAPFLIVLNLLQTISNLFPYKEPTYDLLNLFIIIGMISAIIAVFVKNNMFCEKDEYLKTLAIDIPFTLYYQSNIVNFIFSLNNIFYNSDHSLIYSVDIFTGMMIMLFIFNFGVLIGAKNILQGILFSVLILIYGINTYYYNDTTLHYINDTSIYNIKLSICITFIINFITIVVFATLFYKNLRNSRRDEQKNINLKDPLYNYNDDEKEIVDCEIIDNDSTDGISLNYEEEIKNVNEEIDSIL